MCHSNLKRTALILLLLATCCAALHSGEKSTPETPAVTNPPTKTDPDKKQLAKLKPLTEKEQSQLLAARLDGGMGHDFVNFSNMFVVKSQIAFGRSVGLMTASADIQKVKLQSPFPESYQPTLRQFLDAIALQTSSEWKYDASGKFFKTDVKQDEPIDGPAIFEFNAKTRAKPYEIKLADGWKTVDHGNWVMHVPPSFPIGMDIYEMGTYSQDAGENDKDFPTKIRAAVALQWAQRVNKDATEKDLKPAKVGSFDALYFESMVPSQLKKEIRWRQWVFMDGDRCYFIVSTIFPDNEAKIFPDVEKMLTTFKTRKP